MKSLQEVSKRLDHRQQHSGLNHLTTGRDFEGLNEGNCCCLTLGLNGGEKKVMRSWKKHL